MALDFTLPQEIKSVAEGGWRCVEKEVLPLTKVVEDPRTIFDAAGRYTQRVLELKRQVRRRSAEAGYYLSTARTSCTSFSVLFTRNAFSPPCSRARRPPVLPSPSRMPVRGCG